MKLYKNRFVMDRKTGLTFRLLTAEATKDGTARRRVATSRVNTSPYQDGDKLWSNKTQIAESQLIPLNKIEGIIAFEAEKIMRGKNARSERDLTILDLHKQMLEAKGLSRGAVEALYGGSH